jgi:hypothetical protein
MEDGFLRGVVPIDINDDEWLSITTRIEGRPRRKMEGRAAQRVDARASEGEVFALGLFEHAEDGRAVGADSAA